MQIKAEFKSHFLSLASSKKSADEEFELHKDITTKTKDSLYSFFRTNEGFLSLQEYFFKSLNDGGNDNELDSKSDQTLAADEYSFGKILLNTLNNVEGVYVLDTFDTIDPQCTGLIDYKKFYLCILLWIAKEEGCLTHVLYSYGQQFYETISGGPKTMITAERLLKFGRILGFREELLLENLGKLMGKAMLINEEDFVLFYFFLFNQFDQAFDNFNKIETRGKEGMQKYQAVRVKGGCCTTNVCEII